jgi:hypothetical protein
LKIPNLFLLLSLISFLSIILVTGSTLKSYTNFYENNNYILLKLPTIYAQDNSGNFEDDGIFPYFKTEDNGGKEEEDGDIFPDFKAEDNGGEEKDGGGDGGEEKDGGNEERINEKTHDFSPLSSGSPTNTDDKVNPYVKVNPYGSPTNTDDKVNPDNEVGQPLGQQSEQEDEDSVQVDQQSGQQVDQQTNGTNQSEQQTIGNEVNQTEEQQTNGTNQSEQQTIGNEVNQTEEQQQYTGEHVDQHSSQQP